MVACPLLAHVAAASGGHNVEIEDEVLRQFEKSPNVSVIIGLRDDSGIATPTGVRGEAYVDVLRTKGKYFEGVLPRVLATLNSTDFTFVGKGLFSDTFNGMITKGGLEKLRSDPRISHVHFNYPIEPALAESVPLTGATMAWSSSSIPGVNLTGDGQTICMVDTGINYSHPDLGGCNVTDDINDGSCPTVIGGHDYCPEAALGYCFFEDDNPMEGTGHGTEVAGVILSSNTSLKGVAPDAKLAVVKVMSDSGYGHEYQLYLGIDWCVNQSSSLNITVITTSISSGEATASGSDDCYPTRDLSTAINRARESGIFVDVASGNEGYHDRIVYPACANATSVGASYDSIANKSFGSPAYCSDIGEISPHPMDYITCYTDRAAILDIVAPGSLISTTAKNGSHAIEQSGTSFAAPHVAGAAALLIQYEKLKNNRTLTPKEIEQRFKDTGVLINDTGIYSTNGGSNLTFPRLDVYAALFPLDLSNLTRVYASNHTNVFRFDVMNNYNNQTKNINWSFDVGNGTRIGSSGSAAVGPKQRMRVFVEYDYPDGDIYTVNATATADGGNLTDTESMTMPIGDIIAYDLKEINGSGKVKVFRFRAMNNMNETRAVNWSLVMEGASGVDGNGSAVLAPGKSMMVTVEHDFGPGSSGSYWVYGFVKSGMITDKTIGLETIVP